MSHHEVDVSLATGLVGEGTIRNEALQVDTLVVTDVKIRLNKQLVSC